MRIIRLLASLLRCHLLTYIAVNPRCRMVSTPKYALTSRSDILNVHRFVLVSEYLQSVQTCSTPDYCFLAITTVGYGEITPRSFLGRLITLPLLVFGLLLIALPTFVLGREFSLVWELMEENQVRNVLSDPAASLNRYTVSEGPRHRRCR